jgi:HD-like signal output (HDOD) protein
MQSPLSNDTIPGLNECEGRAVMAAGIARGWASLRADVSPDEVCLAALLSEAGELLLWHFAPELPQRALDELHSGRALRTLQAQQQTLGFTFKQLSLALAESWVLPHLITMLIKGTDNVRANITRVAIETARHITTHPENPAIPADIVNIRNIIHGASDEALLAPLPISAEYKDSVLHAVAMNTDTWDI